MPFPKNAVLTAIFLTGSLVNATAQTSLPEAIAAPGETAMLTLHAEGAQVYECKTSADGALAWTFREPIATLFSNGKTVGRHYAGPTWEYGDVASRRGNGVLSPATTVQRINTVGGKLNGACYKAGTYQSVPYSADYVFLRKG